MKPRVRFISLEDGWDLVYIDDKYVDSRDPIDVGLFIGILEKAGILPVGLVKIQCGTEKFDAQICENGICPEDLPDSEKK